jgi:hypothetical protein
MISIVTEGVKTRKSTFAQVARFRLPPHQGRDFGSRRVTRGIKPCLTASTALLFWLQVSLKTPIGTFDPQSSTLNHFHA